MVRVTGAERLNQATVKATGREKPRRVVIGGAAIRTGRGHIERSFLALAQTTTKILGGDASVDSGKIRFYGMVG